MATEYFDFNGTYYTIDFDALTKIVVTPMSEENKTIVETETTSYFDEEDEELQTQFITREYPRNQEFDLPKFEVLKFILSVVLEYHEETDSKLGMKRAVEEMPLNFKIAFNTLLQYGIIKEITE